MQKAAILGIGQTKVFEHWNKSLKDLGWLVAANKVTFKPAYPRIVLSVSESSIDTIAVHSRQKPLFLQAACDSAKRAYDMTNLSPADIDVFELHDTFSIMTTLSLDSCSFTEQGQGPLLGLNSEDQPNNRLPISIRGGLKAWGHPVGATGV